MKSMFAVHRENNFKVPNQMLIVKSEIHTAVLLRIHLFCYLTLCRLVRVCVRASLSQSFKERKCLLRQSWNIHSPGVRVPWRRRHCVLQKCLETHGITPQMN